MLMETTYYSVFPEGLTETIIEILKKEKLSLNILAKGNNYVVFTSNKNANEVSKLDCFEVSYVLIKYFDKDFSINNQLNWINSNLNTVTTSIKALIGNERKTFRIVESRKSGNKTEFNTAIRKIEDRLSTRVRIDRGHPNFELRVIEKENYGLIGIRITKPPEFIDEFQRNSVRKEIAYVMSYLSEPQNGDIVLDPFCGGGIIPLIRSKYNPYKRIIASDINSEHIKQKLSSLKIRIKDTSFISSPIEKLPQRLDEKVNKIITDPPWGFIQSIPDIDLFYLNTFKTFIEIIENKSIIVILTPHENIIKKIMTLYPRQLFLVTSIPVKVSGYTSTILKIKVS